MLALLLAPAAELEAAVTSSRAAAGGVPAATVTAAAHTLSSSTITSSLIDRVIVYLATATVARRAYVGASDPHIHCDPCMRRRPVYSYIYILRVTR